MNKPRLSILSHTGKHVAGRLNDGGQIAAVRGDNGATKSLQDFDQGSIAPALRCMRMNRKSVIFTAKKR